MKSLPLGRSTSTSPTTKVPVCDDWTAGNPSITVGVFVIYGRARE